MSRTLLINACQPEETRAALVKDGRLEEFRRERSSGARLVGNIYQGRVVNLEKGIGAAFVDVGVGRNGFLHASDCVGAGPDDDADITQRVALGDEVLVQVTRECIGSKGPVLTANVSVPGRFLVILPFATAGGISRRIEESDDRVKLRSFVRVLEKREGIGLIARTAGADRTQRDLLRDLRTLRRLWTSIRDRARDAAVPSLVYAEGDLVIRALRDLVDRHVTEIFVDTPEALARAEETVRAIQPELAPRLRLHSGPVPLFHAFEIETQVDRIHARRVSLPGGGSIVFDSTEALVAIDVNSGRMRNEKRLEETALKTNLEAAREVTRQIRLRDLGGVVVVDFIDMRDPEHVRDVERAMREGLKEDRARVRPGRMGAFGIFVLTRRRARAGAADGRVTCPQCGGVGEVVPPGEVGLRILRELMARADGRGQAPLRARMSPAVAEALEAAHRGALDALSEETGRRLLIEPDPALPPDGWKVETFRPG